MKKKIGIFSLATLLVLSVTLAGCSASPATKVKLSPDDPVSLEVWHYYNGPQKEAFDEMVAEFNDTVGMEKGITVEAFNKGNVNELTDAVLASANKKVGADEVPDIFAGYADTAYQVDKLGMVASLDSYLTKKEIEEYIPSYIEEGRFDSEENLKIFPFAKSMEVMMINKTDWDKFASATGASLDSLNTIEGLTDTAKKYYDWSGGKAFFNRDAMANYMIIGSKQLGVEIFEVKNGEVTFNLDKDVMRKLWDNYYIPFINGYFASYGRFASDDAKTGDIIALVGSSSGATYYPSKVTVSDTESYPIETVVMQAPEFKDGEKVAVQQGAGMVVVKSDERKEYASTVFLKWLTEAKRNIDFSITSGYLPVKKEANTREMLETAMEEAGGNAISDNLAKTLPVAVDITNNNELYTNKAFEGGTNARNILEASMKKKAIADAEAVKAAVASGTAKEAAVAAYNTDENFNQWYENLKKELEKTQK
ncbi:extracellular solute-binding protein [Eubacterium sp. AM05-23]|uniref:extracellular solute-binding protein n=1 Tax=Eubacterium TaxID=1730 RepID=UPI000E497135|nr:MULTISPECIES: extracellular solute-binding protein [Eubacterium]RHO57242.1 extracellular solute-binding protein [Eubacterium sp. AM05-23]